MARRPSPIAVADDGPAVEMQIVRDMLRRGLLAAPVLVALGLLWGIDGALSTAYGVGLAFANFLLAAWLVGAAARRSLALVYAAVLGGYVVRLALITVAVLLVVDASWVDVVPMCLALVVTHLGLLVWETRFVSTSLAHPGLKPRKDAA